MNCDFKIKDNNHTCKRCGFSIDLPDSFVGPLRRNCTSPPTITEKAKNFSKSMVNFAKNKFKTVSQKEAQRRFEICTGTDETPKCEFFNNGTCDKCGCITALKSKIESESCPEGKW